MRIKALALDTGGTILDWHGGISRAFAAAGAKRGLAADWHEVTTNIGAARSRASSGRCTRNSISTTCTAGCSTK